MAATQSNPTTVVVTGDVIFEWRLAKSKIAKRNPNDAPLVDPRSYIQLSYEPSGAIVLGRIIESVVGVQKARIFMPRPPETEEPLRPNGFWVSLALCSQYRMSKGGVGDGKAVWRIDKRLGVDRARRGALELLWRQKNYDGVPYLNPVDASQEKIFDPGKARLVVLEQGRNGFDDSAQGVSNSNESSTQVKPKDDNKQNPFWPPSLREPDEGAWLLTRWSRPGAPNEEKLWRHVREKFNRRIVAVISADHLRYIGARVTRNLSWERTVEDLFDEIGAKWADVFDGCRYLIVSLLPSGALIFDKTDSGLRGKLIYDRDNLAESWSDAYSGEMMGYNRCLTAAIATSIIRNDFEVSMGRMIDGVVAGLVASRRLLVHGFQVEEFDDRDPRDAGLPKSLLFPVTHISNVIRNSLSHLDDVARVPQNDPNPETIELQSDDEREIARDCEFFAKAVDFAPPNRSGGTWSILSSVLEEGRVLPHARGVIEWGRRYDDDSVRFPLLRVGNLVVIDRAEMEGLRTVQSLMADYVKAPFVSKPMSIAVFGPSGSGKSFAITELARALGGSDWPGQPQVEPITFNLSQFTGPASLSSALQRVRDVSLAGKTAIVFWDEFDTHFEIELGWLRYFLGPMQDGRFQDGAMTYHVGRAIFVFAGSLFPTQHHFSKFVREELMHTGYGVQHAGARHTAVAEDTPHAKSPDFMSRLVGFVDVPTLDHAVRGHLDSSVALRRAGLLRAFLRQEGGEPLLQYVRDPNDRRSRGDHHLRRRINVDKGVADAFLRVQRFHYNARSIEAIVKMSTLRGKDAYERSSLPPRAQLALHVDPDEFLDYVASPLMLRER